MAKKKAATAVNKSEEIRKYRDAHKTARPKDIVDGLKAAGVEVSPALVSNVLGAKKKRVKKRVSAKPGPKAKASAAGGESVKVDALIEAAGFAAKVGGVDKAQSILKTLGRLK
ncbi:hypothetical protein Pla175_42580 [Pirellulimonas nuda]|uniref:Uncharacterized protein n=1 Tax=Pirellulimonas nuda TaxID=2528009 RepID=A0A518DH94_9BACT|nr:hypothetical protein [Pirellulimonas nuda]QDU90845.1 hypothetical protein Pla175_42580 [Pirellulimonas nuda]